MINFKNIFSQNLYQSIVDLNEIFVKHNFEIRIVGGCIRDILSNCLQKDMDIDIATNANPSEIRKIFLHNERIFIKNLGGESHGTLLLIDVKYDKKFEITTCRKDVKTFGRFAKVEFTRDFYEDSCRRDFTVNAIYCDINGKIYDYHSGIDDLKNKKIRFIGDARTRIHEDYLRIIRYFRFCNIFATFDDENIDICKNLAHNLSIVSISRLRIELLKMLKFNSYETLNLMTNSGIFNFFEVTVNPKLILKIENLSKNIFKYINFKKENIKLIAMFFDIKNIDFVNNNFSNVEKNIFKLAINNEYNFITLFAKFGLEKTIEILMLTSKNVENEFHDILKIKDLKLPKVDISNLHGNEISKYILKDKIEKYENILKN